MLSSLSFSVLYFFCFLPEFLRVCTAGAITVQDYHLYPYLIPISSPSLSLMTIHTHAPNRSKTICLSHGTYLLVLKLVGEQHFKPVHPLPHKKERFNFPDWHPYYPKSCWAWSSVGGRSWQPYLAHFAHSFQLPLNSFSAGVPAFLQDKILPLWKAVGPCSWILLLWEWYIFIFFSYWAMTYYANSTCFLAVSCC